MEQLPEFSELELDALRELMNIGFGQAAAALSEVIDLRVILTVPRISLVHSADIVDFIDGAVEVPGSYAVVEQPFFGNIRGLGFFILPSGEEAKLCGILGVCEEAERSDFGTRSVQDDALVEIGNIVIGACVGKIAAILKDQVSFMAPKYSGFVRGAEGFAQRIANPSDLALVFKTVFHFEQDALVGFLFLVASEDSIGWIKTAVSRYLEELS